jgi:hypothetical protein
MRFVEPFKKRFGSSGGWRRRLDRATMPGASMLILRIKVFFGTSENAVKTQIGIAVSVYVLVAIVRKRLRIDAGLYQILQILSLTQFEKTLILQTAD